MSIRWIDGANPTSSRSTGFIGRPCVCLIGLAEPTAASVAQTALTWMSTTMGLNVWKLANIKHDDDDDDDYYD